MLEREEQIPLGETYCFIKEIIRNSEAMSEFFFFVLPLILLITHKVHRLSLVRAEEQLGGEQHFCLIWKRGMLLLALFLYDASSPLCSCLYTVKRIGKSLTKKSNLEQHSGYQ